MKGKTKLKVHLMIFKYEHFQTLKNRIYFSTNDTTYFSTKLCSFVITENAILALNSNPLIKS